MSHISSAEIRLDGLRFFARHGVMEQERTVGGDFTVDVALALKPDVGFDRAALGDELEGTVDYGEVFAIVRREMGVPSRLLEHVARRIADAVLAGFPLVETVRVTVRKDNPPLGAACSGSAVTMTVER